MRVIDLVLAPFLLVCAACSLILPIYLAAVPTLVAGLVIVCCSDFVRPPRTSNIKVKKWAPKKDEKPTVPGVPPDTFGLRLRGGHGAGCPCEGAEKSMVWLYDEVDFAKTYSMNTENGQGVAEALRPSCERAGVAAGLLSSDDEQVLMCVNFRQYVNLKEIAIDARGPSCPRVLRAFANREVTDFDQAEEEPASKEWTLQDGTATALSIENVSAFRQIRSLTIFVRENFGSDQTKIDWIGLKGERLDVKIGGIVQNAEYELRPGSSLDVPGATSGPFTDHMGF